MGGLDRLKKRKAYKFQFDLTLHYITNLPCNDLIVYITWKRGKKRQGGTKKTLVKDHIAVWEEEISVSGTLFKDTATNMFKKKYIEFSVWEDAGTTKKRDRLVGELNLNLAEFVNAMGDFAKTQVFSIRLHKNYSVGAGKSPSPISETVSGIESALQCKMTIKSRWRNDPTSSGLRKDFLTDESDLTTATSVEPDSETKSYDEDKSIDEDEERSEEDLSDKVPSALDDRISLEHGAAKDGATSENNNDVSINDKYRRFNYLKSRSRQKQSKNIRVTSMDLTAASQFSSLATDAQLSHDAKPPEIVIQPPARQPQAALPREAPTPEVPRDLEETIRRIKEQEKELESLRRQALLKNRAEAERVLIDVAIFGESTENKFSNRIPVSALLIFRTLMEWDCFGLNATPAQRGEKINQSGEIFRKIARGIETMIQKHANNTNSISYWLSNVSFLLNLVLQRFPNFSNSRRVGAFGNSDLPDGTAGRTYLRLDYADPNSERPFEIASSSSSTSRAPGSPNSLAKSGMELVEESFFENPVWNFQNDLTVIAHKAYLNLLRNIYNELTVILVPSVFELTTTLHKTKFSITNVLSSLERFFCTLQENFVNSFIVNQIFAQIFYLVDAFLLNTLLVASSPSTSGTSQSRMLSKGKVPGNGSPQLCSMGRALQLKMAVTRMEEWADLHSLTSDVKLQLIPLRQASDVMIMNKNALVEDTVLRDVCPSLTAQQLITLLSRYKPDELDPDEVPVSVLQALADKFKISLTPSSSNNASSFELDIGFVRRPNFVLPEIIDASEVVVAPASLYAVPGFEFLTRSNKPPARTVQQ